MVWGLFMPTIFGKFFPDGHYTGWRHDLEKYFSDDMPIDQKALFKNGPSYPYYVTTKFTEDPNKNSHGRPPFTPIEAHGSPKRFVLEKKYRSLGSLITTEDQILTVDEPFKDIIEHLDLGTHQFFPLHILNGAAQGPDPHSDWVLKRYFILVIGRHIDSFSPGRSDPGSWRYSDLDLSSVNDADQTFFCNRDKEPMSKIALSMQVFSSAHLWRERRMVSPLICISDALRAEIVKAGLHLPKHYRLKEI